VRIPVRACALLHLLLLPRFRKIIDTAALRNAQILRPDIAVLHSYATVYQSCAARRSCSSPILQRADRARYAHVLVFKHSQQNNGRSREKKEPPESCCLSIS
jgi:hypothetical protein